MNAHSGWRRLFALILSLAVDWPAAVAAESVVPLRAVAQVELGHEFSCSLGPEGGASCWGSNEFGQLGQREGSFSVRTTPVPVPSAGRGLRRLAVGGFHACAVTASSGVTCWGRDLGGALGDGPGNGGPTAVVVPGLSGVAGLAAGAAHTCALLDSGAVRCWGLNEDGQVGNDARSAEVDSPVEVVGLGGPVRAIAAGAGHSCAILLDGRVMCWGDNSEGQLGDGSTTDRLRPVLVQGLPGPVRVLALGGRASCALTEAGALFCWGPQYPLAAFEGGSLRARAYPGFESGGIDVDAGVFHFCVLDADGSVECFGDGSDGQFGTGPIDSGLEPGNVIGLAPNVVQISAGGHHSCARNRAGGVQCWGLNTKGQLGTDSITRRLVPTQVVGLTSGVDKVVAGQFHSCALSLAGGVECWGGNDQNSLGDGTGQVRLTPVEVVGLQAGVRVLATGSFHTCAINASRRVQCWGANFDGRLGNGNLLNSAMPVDVQGLGNVDALALALGDSHACAVLAGGAVKCWGTNAFGQLGDGTTQDRLAAVDVVGLGSGVRAISAGYANTCAITSGGALKCWGANGAGQLGDGTRINRSAPVDVVGLGSGVLIAGSGEQHSCAVVTGGAVKCWGFSFFGRILGDESTSDRSVPGDVPSLRSGVVGLAVGSYATCVRLDTGAMACWGAVPIGDNTEISRGLRTGVAGLGRDVSDIDVGFGGQLCAVMNGAAKCWGENGFGQVGDGTTHGVPLPQVVVVDEEARRVAALARQGNAASRNSSSDASGRFVVFESDASNLVPNDTNGRSDIFRIDRETGLTERVSVDDAEGQIAGASIEPSVSANGQYVVFVAPAAAVAKLHGEGRKAGQARRKSSGSVVYLRNMLSGTTQSMGSATMAGAGTEPQLAPSATAVAFTSDNPTGSIGPPGKENVYYVPLTPDGASLVPGPVTCVSCKALNADGTPGADADGESRNVAISADGKQVAYETTSKNALVAAPSPCPTGSADILLRDLLSGSAQRMSPAASMPSASCGSSGSTAPSIDYAGNTLAFQSDSILSGSDGNGVTDIYVVQAGAPEAPLLVSQSPDGVTANGASSEPSLSGDGNSVAFVSSAQNLDLSFADNNDRGDVHTASLQGDVEIARLSRGPTGAESDAPSDRPAMNFDGSRVAFDSAAQNLAPGSGGEVKVYQRDNPLAAPVRSATFWKSNESGWGLTVFDQGNVLAPAWFTYDVDGEPTWFLIGGAFPQADGSYRGDLLRLTGTPFDRIEGPAATSASTIGNVALRFLGDAALEFDYNVQGVQQSKTLTRFPFGTRNFACTASPQAARDNASNYSDLWTSTVPNAGWGLTLFHVDASLFAGWYTYDADGEAVFFVLATTRQSDGSFAGSIFRQRNGTPFAQIADANASPGNDLVGDATFRFSDGDSGTFSYRIGAVNQSKSITRFLVGSRPSVCESVDDSGSQ